ncbi:putative Late embryogenesis abundant protein [Cocos nucifera]|nr:putative Late embryogenesis abundant protein [Cocos nucifera]
MVNAESRRGLELCRFPTRVVIIVTLVILCSTVFFCEGERTKQEGKKNVHSLNIFKPKDPEVEVKPADLQHFDFGLFPSPSLNLTLGLDVGIKNPNDVGFQYDSTTTWIYYREVLIGQAPIEAGKIDARSTMNTSTVVVFQVENLISNQYFFRDILSGTLNFTASSSVEGKVILLKVIKIHVSVYVSCDLTIYLVNKTSEHHCRSHIKI